MLTTLKFFQSLIVLIFFQIANYRVDKNKYKKEKSKLKDGEDRGGKGEERGTERNSMTKITLREINKPKKETNNKTKYDKKT